MIEIRGPVWSSGRTPYASAPGSKPGGDTRGTGGPLLQSLQLRESARVPVRKDAL